MRLKGSVRTSTRCCSRPPKYRFVFRHDPHNAYGDDSSYELFGEPADRLSDFSPTTRRSSITAIWDRGIKSPFQRPPYLGDTIRDYARRYVSELS